MWTFKENIYLLGIMDGWWSIFQIIVLLSLWFIILFGYSNNLDLVILLSPRAPKKTKKSEEKSIWAYVKPHHSKFNSFKW